MARKPILIKQQDQKDCAAACVASIAAYYGTHVPVSQVREFVSTDKHGTTMLGIVQGAEELGFRAKGVRCPEDALEQLPTPFIAHIVREDGTHHFVVVYRLKRNKVLVADPAEEIAYVSREHFADLWSGNCVLMEPDEGFESFDARESNIARFVSLLRPHKGLVAESVLAAVFHTVLGLSTAFYVSAILDSVLVSGNAKLLTLLSLGMLGIVGFRGLFGIARRYLLLLVSQKIDATLVLGYYRHLMRLPQSFFDTRQVGEIVSRMNDAVKIRSAISGTTLTIIVDSLMVFISTSVLFMFSPQLGLLLSTVIPVFLLTTFVLRKPIRVTQRRSMEQSAEMQAHVTSTVDGIETIKSLGAAKYVNLKSEMIFTGILQRVKEATKLQIANSTVSEVASGIAVIGAFWFGGTLVFEGQLSTGELVASYTLLGYMLSPLNRLLGVHQSVQDALVAADRLYEILALETESKQASKSIDLQKSSVRGHIQFQDVSFRYGARRTVLNNVTMQFAPGNVTAIVGESGSGKSTLFRLIQRLYECESGNILFDNIDLKDISPESLRSVLGIVPQNIEIFAGSVMDNVAFGELQPDAKRVMELCQLIGADKFINKLPNRYNTLLGEHGVSLSGGQRQLIAIARALYKGPRVLLLDEATANLDSLAEESVQRVLDLLSLQGITVVVIAHRLGTVSRAHNIYVMHEGTVLQSGSHAELFQEPGKYRELWERQSPALGSGLKGPDSGELGS